MIKWALWHFSISYIGLLALCLIFFIVMWHRYYFPWWYIWYMHIIYIKNDLTKYHQHTFSHRYLTLDLKNQFCFFVMPSLSLPLRLSTLLLAYFRGRKSSSMRECLFLACSDIFNILLHCMIRITLLHIHMRPQWANMSAPIFLDQSK